MPSRDELGTGLIPGVYPPAGTCHSVPAPASLCREGRVRRDFSGETAALDATNCRPRGSGRRDVLRWPGGARSWPCCVALAALASVVGLGGGDARALETEPDGTMVPQAVSQAELTSVALMMPPSEVRLDR